MRSPPADIFVWGVHPSTTVEDIVQDLSDSDIKIEAKEIVKMSKPSANLCSYKISVLNTDLQKALDPGIWLLRVRVREFIYYSNKPKQSDTASKNQNRKESTPRGGQRDSPQFTNPGNNYLNVPTFSRFEPLRLGNMLNVQQ